ncbi:MAG: prepilin-type N-terminal cleavage/methylation domain-containing protein [Burkholderiales bacterium]
MPRSPRFASTRRPSIKHVGGFTLIEVLISLFVLALMAAMAWQGVDLVVRSRDVAQQRTDALMRLQAGLAQWEADLHAAIDTQVVPGLGCDAITLRLTRKQADGVQVVAWSLRSGTLYRWTAPLATGSEALQSAWLQTYQLQGSEAGTLRVLDGVRRIDLYQFLSASNAWSNCQSTGNIGASGQQALPDGIRLVLSPADGAGFGGPISRNIQLVHP